MQGSSSTALSTGTFLSGVGVDTHIPYTDGGYAKIATVISDLNYLGINQVRDGISNGVHGAAPLSSFVTLAKAGIHFTFVTKAASSAELASTIALDDQLQTAVPGAIVALEGPNEINNAPVVFNGVGGLQGALNLQSAIYKSVHSDPTLAHVAVDYFTGYAAGSIGVGPDPTTTPGLADFDNQHPYPRHGEAPATWVARSGALPNTTNANAPAVYTETGYSTVDVSPTVQAKFTLDLLFDTASQGVSRTYLYELMDAYAPGSAQGDHGWGLFDYTGAAKPAATAIHNLTTILKAAGTGAAVSQASSLTYQVTGLASTGHTMMLSNPNGTYDVVVWAEPKIWDATTHHEIAATAQTATISLSSAVAGYSVYDPLTGTSAISSGGPTSTIKVTLTDHPVIIELGAAGGATPPVTPPTTPTPPTTTPSSTVGTANADTLVAPDGQSNNLHGLAGADSITGGSGYNNLHGDQGDDTIVGRSLVGDQLMGGQGNDLISAQSKAHNLLFGDLGNDTLVAGSGGDTLRGDAGDDVLAGGAGNDFLSGDTGHDTATGGAGADIFRGATGMGTTIVTDFHQSEGDRIRLDHGAQYTVTQSGADVHIDLIGGGEMVLKNTLLSSLHSGWLFVN